MLRHALPAFCLALSFALTACGQPPQQKMPPAMVGVTVIKESPVTLTTELPGRTSPFAVSEIRPQVSGIILKHLFVEGSTAALSTIEYEPGALADLQRALEQIAPMNADYAHNAAWGDGNGYAHLRAALLKPDLCVPIRCGNLALGTWQQIILIDFDNRPRERRVLATITAAVTARQR